MNQASSSVNAFHGKWWAMFFLATGGGGFFYEVGFGHDKFWGAACVLWAAGGPALVADFILKRGLR